MKVNSLKTFTAIVLVLVFTIYFGRAFASTSVHYFKAFHNDTNRTYNVTMITLDGIVKEIYLNDYEQNLVDLIQIKSYRNQIKIEGIRR